MSTSISCNEAAAELLRQCLKGDKWDEDLVRVVERQQCSDALFRILVEGLADQFDPRLCDAYAKIFSGTLEREIPVFRSTELYARYERVRKARVCTVHPKRVAILSRVTLGADIAITSVIVHAISECFPEAEIVIAGASKAAELFARYEKVSHFDVVYPRRGSLHERLASWEKMAGAFDDNDTIVVDPDSRLTQLGLLPLCDENRYFFFESRAFGGVGEESLTTLTKRWVAEIFGANHPVNLILPPMEPFGKQKPMVTVSFGTADNQAKEMPPTFERELVKLLCARFPTVLVDSGFGGEEAARVIDATDGTTARVFRGSFARFASLIAVSDCFVGYDSAGQHAAAAFGTPLISVFKGFASDRMFQRWQPTGPGPKKVFRVDQNLSLETIEAELDRLEL